MSDGHTDKIIKSQLNEAKITFENNGWEEERYSLQELQEENERLRKALQRIEDESYFSISEYKLIAREALEGSDS